MMNNVGMPGFLFILIATALVVIPFWKLLPKFGYSKWIALTAIIPAVPLVLLWVLAFSSPTDGEENS